MDSFLSSDNFDTALQHFLAVSRGGEGKSGFSAHLELGLFSPVCRFVPKGHDMIE